VKMGSQLKVRKFSRNSLQNTGCKIFPFFFPNWRAMRTLMKTINFGRNLRLSQIQPIKTAEIKSIQFEKKKRKTLNSVFYPIKLLLEARD
jgi:hypothetical protein